MFQAVERKGRNENGSALFTRLQQEDEEAHGVF